MEKQKRRKHEEVIYAIIIYGYGLKCRELF